MTNDLFARESWYFRNALVRANYENQRLNVVKTRLPLEEFFKVLLFGYDLELKNRFLRIGCEYGSPVAGTVSGLHRENVVINGEDDVINVVKDVVKENPLSEAEEKAAKTILRGPKTTAAELATLLRVTPRQAQRVIASLKVKAGLKRRGGRKSGEWYFEQAN